MTIKYDVKVEEELTCRFKIDTTVWGILTQALTCLKHLHFNGLSLTKYIIFELKKYRKVMFDGNKDWCKKFEAKLTCAFQNDMKNLANFHILDYSNFILENKIEDLNETKTSKEPDW